jgi:hypothetical protein
LKTARTGNSISLHYFQWCRSEDWRVWFACAPLSGKQVIC